MKNEHDANRWLKLAVVEHGNDGRIHSGKKRPQSMYQMPYHIEQNAGGKPWADRIDDMLGAGLCIFACCLPFAALYLITHGL